MAKNINFTVVEIEYVQVRLPDNTTPELEIQVTLTSAADDRLPRNVRGWTGVTPATRAALGAALNDLVLERAAAALEVPVGSLVRVGNRIYVP